MSSAGAPTRPHWLNAERLHVYPRIIAVIFAVVAVGYALTIHDGLDLRGAPVGADFVTFYSASMLVLSGQADQVFDTSVLAAAQQAVFPAYHRGVFAWFYPPTFLAVVAPLSLLPYLAALAVFVGATATAWVLTLRRAVDVRGAAWLIAAFPGLWICLAQGQNGFLTAAIAGGCLLLVRRYPIAAGMVLGLLAIKPHLAVLFAVALLAARAWKTLVAAAVSAAAFLSASLLAFGSAILPAWLDSLQLARIASEQGGLPWVKMPSTFAMLRLWGVPVEWAYVGHGLVAAAAAVAVWLVWRRSQDLALRGAVVMTATFLVNPYAFDYDLVWLSFPIAWFAVYGVRQGWRRGDREVLVACWSLPAVGTVVATLANVQIAPLVLGAMVWVVLRRTRTGTGQLSAESPPPDPALRQSSPPA